MKRSIFIVMVLLLITTGCAQLDERAEEIAGVVQASEPVAKVLDPATQGGASMVWLMLSNLITAGLVINRAVVAKKRAEAIEEIEEADDTPAASKQAKSAKARKTIREITG